MFSLMAMQAFAAVAASIESDSTKNLFEDAKNEIQERKTKFVPRFDQSKPGLHFNKFTGGCMFFPGYTNLKTADGAEEVSCYTPKYDEDRDAERSSGSFGTVLLATERSSGRQVAIKMADVKGDTKKKKESNLSDFKSECAFGKVVDPKFAIKVHDCWYDDMDKFWIVMDNGGKELGKILENSFTDWESIRKVMYDLTEGVADLHEKGIIHRDLKPENILYDTESKTAKIMDFGLSEMASRSGFFGKWIHGPRSGSPAYMAPEQYKHVAFSNDVWALGCVFINLLCLSTDIDDQWVKQKNNSGWLVGTQEVGSSGFFIPKNVDVQLTQLNIDYSWPAGAKELVKKMLTFDHKKRITLKDLLKDSFFKAFQIDDDFDQVLKKVVQEAHGQSDHIEYHILRDYCVQHKLRDLSTFELFHKRHPDNLLNVLDHAVLKKLSQVFNLF